MQARPVSSKISTQQQLKQQIEENRKNGKKTVFTNGCFDILHVGHLRYLKEAAKQGDALIVAINADEEVKRQKGESRPYIKEDERARILASLECVDHVHIFTDPTPENLLEDLQPDILIKGGDYGVDGVVGRKIVWEYGGEVKVLCLTEGKSSSEIIAKIQSTN